MTHNLSLMKIVNLGDTLISSGCQEQTVQLSLLSKLLDTYPAIKCIKHMDCKKTVQLELCDTMKSQYNIALGVI